MPPGSFSGGLTKGIPRGSLTKPNPHLLGGVGRGLADHTPMRLKFFIVPFRAVVREEQLADSHEENDSCGHDERHAPCGLAVGDSPETVPDAHHQDLRMEARGRAEL